MKNKMSKLHAKWLKENINLHLEKNSTKKIKFVIGDSIYNHRALTVNQLIRFLTRKNASQVQRSFGDSLKFAYQNLKPHLYDNRNSPRTDALDINEFMDILEYSRVLYNSAA